MCSLENLHQCEDIGMEMTSANSASCWTADLDGKVIADMMKAKKAGGTRFNSTLSSFASVHYFGEWAGSQVRLW
jgi:hypothetical protein